MRTLKYLVLALILVCLVVLSLANREIVTLHLLPGGMARVMPLSLQVPLFVVVLSYPVLGERVHAVVVTRHAVGSEVLRAWCAERLSDYKVPETMQLISEPLPRNANGKVIKRQLREAFVAGT